MNRDIVFLLPKCVEHLELCQAKTKSQKLYPDMPCGCQGPSYVGCILFPPRCISREVDGKQNSQSSNQDSVGMSVSQASPHLM